MCSDGKPGCRVSSETEPTLLSPSSRAFLEDWPIALALVTIGQATRLTLTNAPWQAFWQVSDPELAVAGAPLERLLAASVDAVGSAALGRAVAEGRPLDRLLAVDRLGPVVLRVRGCRLDGHYLLAIEPELGPHGLAAGWPSPELGLAWPDTFGYTAALAVDGSWTITGAVPDFRPVLRLAASCQGWLDRVAPGDRRALRSRHLQLLAGAAQSLRYRIELEDGERLTLDDVALPVRHPLTGEVIGLLGRVQLAADDQPRRSIRPPAPGEFAGAGNQPVTVRNAAADPAAPTMPGLAAARMEAVVEGLQAVGSAALLLAVDGRVLACNAAAGNLLDDDPEALVGRAAGDVLFGGEATAEDWLDQVLGADPARTVSAALAVGEAAAPL